MMASVLRGVFRKTQLRSNPSVPERVILSGTSRVNCDGEVRFFSATVSLTFRTLMVSIVLETSGRSNKF